MLHIKNAMDKNELKPNKIELIHEKLFGFEKKTYER